VTDSLLLLPARIGVRTARSVLTTTRDLSQQALGIVDLVGQIVETPAWDDGEMVIDVEVIEE
jgi:hypothetical protein